ncbi:hypothetical protein [Providencia sp. PROV255]|uniref:hypothetical protein n=1 Tax=Providencia sp. PROV255 TaxID=2949943 RepID=UPI00234A5961|nr:hypothetical protein [Providencia sp. PROV255]
MKRILAVTAVVALLVGCGESDPKYDGEYTCYVNQVYNDDSIERGSDYAFPLGTKIADILVKNREITVIGMKSGSYTTPKLNEKKDSDGNDVLFLDDKSLGILFSKHAGIFNVVYSDKSGQLLMNCKLK